MPPSQFTRGVNRRMGNSCQSRASGKYGLSGSSLVIGCLCIFLCLRGRWFSFTASRYHIFLDICPNQSVSVLMLFISPYFFSNSVFMLIVCVVYADTRPPGLTPSVVTLAESSHAAIQASASQCDGPMMLPPTSQQPSLHSSALFR